MKNMLQAYWPVTFIKALVSQAPAALTALHVYLPESDILTEITLRTHVFSLHLMS